MTTAAHPRRPLELCTLAGPTRGQPALAGNVISGRSGYPVRIGAERKLLDEFANWPSAPSDLLRFTKRHGPLTVRAKEGQRATYSFTTTQWRKCQREFRELWESLLLKPGQPASILTLLGYSGSFNCRPGEHFDGRYGALRFEASNLFRLLCLELITVPVERVRKCTRPDCEHPYFIAPHLRQQYCSEMCANWAQRGWKKRWWKEKGNARRRERAGQLKK